ASHMTGMGISRLVVAKILNHVESGITAVYDRHSYDAEKRQALNAWGRKIQSILHGEPNDVVPLQSRPGPGIGRPGIIAQRTLPDAG
ncbi:MAG TPA: hypothetical protein VHJ19_09435, partial [Gammaproteobacteria bacterium]|nr:hypothetical protein [Gammaproteobacteria bacterium]